MPVSPRTVPGRRYVNGPTVAFAPIVGAGTVGADHLGALADVDVGQGRVRADDGVPRHRGGAVQLGVGQQADVLVQGDGGIDPGGCRINDGDAGPHPGLDGAPVVFGAERRELDPVVGAFNLPAVFRDDGGDAAAGGAREAQDVGEVLLALGVVGGDVHEGVAQHGGVEGVDSGVDLPDRAFGFRGVLVLADARDRSVRGAEDAAVPGGVVQDGGEDGDGVARPPRGWRPVRPAAPR